MIKRLLTLSLLSALIFGFISVPNVHAQQNEGAEIGYVDPQAILDRMPEMKAVQQRLQNFVESKREEFVTKQQDFQTQVNEYQQKASVISDDAQRREEERLGELNAELQQYQQTLEEEIQERQQELVSPLLDQIDTAVNNVAQQMGLAYVLNTTTSNGDVIILYASDEAQERYDITDEVMDELDM